MKKIKKNQIIISCLAIMLAVVGYLNYTGDIKDLMSKDNIVNADSDNVINTDEYGNIISNDVDGDYEDVISASKEEAENTKNSQAKADDNSSEPGSVILTSGNSLVSNVISEAKLNREQVRAKNKEVLMEIVENDTLLEDTRKAAVDKLAQMSDVAQKEMAAELLLEAKGFAGAVVSMVDGCVDVVIDCDELSDSQRVQVEDIVKRKTGVLADKITINICNN